MKNIISILAIVILLASCSNTEKSTQVVSESAPKEVKVSLEYANPSFVAGSTFGEFFISMIRTQNYDMALKFTSKGSKEKFGVESIMKKYKSYDFNYSLKLKSVVQVADTFNLLYTTNEYATGKMKKMTVVVENDTCKLVLQDKNYDILK